MLSLIRGVISRLIGYLEMHQDSRKNLKRVCVLSSCAELGEEVDHSLTADFSIVNNAKDCDAVVTDQLLTFLRFVATKKFALYVNRNFYKASDALKLRDLSWRLMCRAGATDEIINFNRRVNNELLASKSADCCLMLATGPSISTLNRADLSSLNKRTIIGCNSVVKNIELLDRLGKLDILCFADPVFHFSSSAYCFQFIKDVKATIEKFDPYIVVPITALPLAQKILGGVTKKIVGMEHGSFGNFPRFDAPQVCYTPNILTSIMLPLAVSLADEILFAGFDGRAPNETYFWKHNREAQYESLMSGVFEKHPSFLRDQDLRRYYKEHLVCLESLLRLLARQKPFTWRSLTPTHIDILKAG